MEGGKGGGKKLNWMATHALKTQGNTADSQEGGEDILFTQGLMHLRARASYTTHTRQIWEREESRTGMNLGPEEHQGGECPGFSFAPIPWTGCWRNCPPETPRGQTRPPRKASL